MARSLAVATIVIAVLLVPLVSSARAAPPNGRPLPYQRKFVAPVIDQLIANLSAQIKDPVLATLFSNCLPNTLDTTVEMFTNSTDPLQIDTYIVTGDIPAMWLRDSTNQVWPYVKYAKEDAALQSLLRGLINRQVKSVLIDPYANAFTSGLHDVLSPNMETDTTSFMGFLGSSVNAMTLNLWERKYELDSLVSVMRLSWYYYEVTGDTSVFDSRWLSAMQLIIQTIEAEQAGSDEGYTYYFNRLTTVPTDTLQWSVGPPGRRCGLSRSPFRPSDDAAIMPYPVAANAYAVVYLTRIAPLIESLNASLASQALSLASEINASLHTYGVFNRGGSSMLAYEVDGFGNGYFMDDANVPSLLSLPYLGWLSSSDPLYLSTRAFVLSTNNPYYFSGSAGAGIGGPHNGLGYVWPISIMMQAFTSNSDAEILNCLALLKSSSAGTGFMHESFWQDDVTQFTRPWFAWANSLFGELMLYIAQTRPYLILR